MFGFWGFTDLRHKNMLSGREKYGLRRAVISFAPHQYNGSQLVMLYCLRFLTEKAYFVNRFLQVTVGRFLAVGGFWSNFALANKLQERIKAAAQHSSSELGSAFTLHFICSTKSEE